MRFGLIARSEDRGLGNQTYEIARALRPDRVLLVDMGDLAGGFPSHPERYSDLGLNVTIVPHDQLGEWGAMRPWLHGLDVVYTAETFYSPRFVNFADAEGVATVCHLNPEFYKHGHEPDWRRPTEWWLPSPWLQNDPRLPSDAVLMPMPVPTDHISSDQGRPAVHGRVRMLHVAGKPAMGDRNGTRVLFQGIRQCTSSFELTVRAQAQSIPHPSRIPRGIKYSAIPGNAADYRSMYQGFDVLVLPRRYGGLCLPVIEAAASGCAVVMTDCDPNWFYPARLVEPNSFEDIKTPLGVIRAYDAGPQALGAALDALAEDTDLVELARFKAAEWAQVFSWEEQAGRWWDRLGTVVKHASQQRN